jgi:hypothetical protein
MLRRNLYNARPSNVCQDRKKAHPLAGHTVAHTHSDEDTQSTSGQTLSYK